MTDARVDWWLHTTAGALPVGEGSSWGLDTTWSPHGHGAIRVGLAEWELLGLDPLERHHFLLECRSTPYAETGDLAVTFASSTTGAWPTAPAHPYDPAYGTLLEASAVRWHVYLENAEEDRASGVVTLSVSTFELQVVEATNLGEDWMPESDGGATYALGRVALQLFRYLGIPASVGWADGRTIPATAMEPWKAGTSAWDWLERLRAKGGYSLRVDPELDTLTYGPQAPIADGTVPEHYPLQQHSRALGGVGATDGLEYADAVRVRWAWTVNGEQVEQVETVMAGDIADWRDVRRVVEVELPGPPIAGRAADIADELRRWRSVAHFAWPLTWPVPTLGKGDAQFWRTLQYNIADATMATGTVIVNA